MKKVLVTGCSGYIGQHLCKYLKSFEGEYEVWGVDCIPPVDDTVMDEYRYVNITGANELLAGGWNKYKFDAVVHLAALVQVGESVLDPVGYYETNVQGTLNVLRYMSYDNFIFASTGAAERPSYVPYPASKVAAEQIVRQYITQPNPFRRDISHTIFRFYNVIGSFGYKPTNPDGLFYNLMKAEQTGVFNLYGDDYKTDDGTAIRDYVHVYEICYALELAIRKPSCVPGADIQPYVECLGHGKGHSVKQIIDAYKKVNVVDFEVVVKPRREGDLEKSVLDDVSPYMQQLFTLEDLVKYK